MTDEKSAKIPRVEPEVPESSLCLVCQKKGEALVKTPAASSFERLLDFIHTRATYGDGNYPMISENLRGASTLSLMTNKRSWYRNCYLQVCHIHHRDANVSH